VGLTLIALTCTGIPEGRGKMGGSHRGKVVTIIFLKLAVSRSRLNIFKFNFNFQIFEVKFSFSSLTP
jgi:hypothetical protein